MADVTNTLMGAAVLGIGAGMAMKGANQLGGDYYESRPRGKKKKRRVRRRGNMVGGLIGTAAGLSIMGAGMNAMNS